MSCNQIYPSTSSIPVLLQRCFTQQQYWRIHPARWLSHVGLLLLWVWWYDFYGVFSAEVVTELMPNVRRQNKPKT